MSDLGRALFNYFKQVAWALFLVYLILGGAACLFGKQIGYDTVLWVCLGIALLVTVTFISIYLFDSFRVILGELNKRSARRSGKQEQTNTTFQVPNDKYTPGTKQR
jgi:hypothetical protein